MPQLGPVELETNGTAAESMAVPYFLIAVAAARGASIKLAIAFISDG